MNESYELREEILNAVEIEHNKKKLKRITSLANKCLKGVNDGTLNAHFALYALIDEIGIEVINK